VAGESGAHGNAVQAQRDRVTLVAAAGIVPANADYTRKVALGGGIVYNFTYSPVNARNPCAIMRFLTPCWQRPKPSPARVPACRALPLPDDRWECAFCVFE